MISLPRGVWDGLRDGIAGRTISAARSRWRRTASSPVTATGLKPRGSFVSLSPWEFQTWSCSGNPRNSGARGILHPERALAVFALLAFLDPAAKILRQRSARHSKYPAPGTPRLKMFLSGSGRGLGIDRRRPAGQDDAAGLERGRFSRRVCRSAGWWNRRCTRRMPARDDLGVLRPEVEDDDLFVHELKTKLNSHLPGEIFAREKCSSRAQSRLNQTRMLERTRRWLAAAPVLDAGPGHGSPRSRRSSPSRVQHR